MIKLRGYHQLGSVLGAYGVRSGAYSPEEEGVIHEIAHIAAMQEILGWGASEGMIVLLGSRGDALDRLNEFMVRAYVAQLQIVAPYYFGDLGKPVWQHWDSSEQRWTYASEAHQRAERKFAALSDKLEAYAQAATYLVLYRAGVERYAEHKFGDSAGGSNRVIRRYVDKCVQALHTPLAGRIADRTESLMLEALSFALASGVIQAPHG